MVRTKYKFNRILCSNKSNSEGYIMQLAIDVFIDMFKSKEIYIIIGGAIIMWIALEWMDKNV